MTTFLTYFAATMGVGAGLVLTMIAISFVPATGSRKRNSDINEQSLDALKRRNEISERQVELMDTICTAVKYLAYTKE